MRLPSKLDDANILWIGEHAGKTRIDQESLRAGNARAQMAGARKHALAGNDLNSFDEAAL